MYFIFAYYIHSTILLLIILFIMFLAEGSHYYFKISKILIQKNYTSSLIILVSAIMDSQECNEVEYYNIDTCTHKFEFRILNKYFH